MLSQRYFLQLVVSLCCPNKLYRGCICATVPDTVLFFVKWWYLGKCKNCLGEEMAYISVDTIVSGKAVISY